MCLSMRLGFFALLQSPVSFSLEQLNAAENTFHTNSLRGIFFATLFSRISYIELASTRDKQ